MHLVLDQDIEAIVAVTNEDPEIRARVGETGRLLAGGELYEVSSYDDWSICARYITPGRELRSGRNIPINTIVYVSAETLASATTAFRFIE